MSRESKPARRRLRVDARLLIGVALVAASILGGLRLAAAADRTDPAVVVRGDLPAGHVLTAADVDTTQVQLEADVRDHLVDGRAGTVVGRTLARPVRRGSLLADADLGRGPADAREITIPVDPQHALGGALRAGDRVDVLASFGKGADDARTLTVVGGASVVEVVRDSGVFGQDGSMSALTLQVPADDAVFLAFAARNGELDVVRAAARPGARTRYDLAELP